MSMKNWLNNVRCEWCLLRIEILHELDNKEEVLVEYYDLKVVMTKPTCRDEAQSLDVYLLRH